MQIKKEKSYWVTKKKKDILRAKRDIGLASEHEEGEEEGLLTIVLNADLFPVMSANVFHLIRSTKASSYCLNQTSIHGPPYCETEYVLSLDADLFVLVRGSLRSR
jgi:hypothetical protein